jgi:phosphopantetheinyl transferase
VTEGRGMPPFGIGAAACRLDPVPGLAELLARLHPAERQDLARLRHPDRLRAAAVARLLLRAGLAGLPPAGRLTPLDTRCLRGAGHGPPVRYRDPPADRCPVVGPPPWVSLAHDGGYCLAAWCPAGPVGCDVESVAPRTGAFLLAHFRPAERRRAGGDPTRATVFWTVKEAYFKLTAARGDAGEVFVPAAVAVEVDRVPAPPDAAGTWSAFACRCGPAREYCRGAVARIGSHLFTVLTAGE